MQLITRRVEDQPLTVIVEYPDMDREVERIIEKLTKLDIHFMGKTGEQTARIALIDVYYIENVERKLFLYTKEEVYRLEIGMSELADMEHTSGLVRVSRTCVINIDHLQEIRQLKNSHLEAQMDNGEKIIVSRKYLREIKKAFFEQDGRE